jgi:hypothetical protein
MNSNIFDVQSFRETDCDTDHYVVAAKVSGRWSVSKQEHTTVYNKETQVKLNKACFPIACLQSYKSSLVEVLFRQCKFIVSVGIATGYGLDDQVGREFESR